jgi:hypothetical protein
MPSIMSTPAVCGAAYSSRSSTLRPPNRSTTRETAVWPASMSTPSASTRSVTTAPRTRCPRHPGGRPHRINAA